MSTATDKRIKYQSLPQFVNNSFLRLQSYSINGKQYINKVIHKSSDIAKKTPFKKC